MKIYNIIFIKICFKTKKQRNKLVEKAKKLLKNMES